MNRGTPWLALSLMGFATACASGAAEMRIRETRAAFNTAIASHDREAIAHFLAPSYKVIAGRSVSAQGKEESRLTWDAMFREDPDVVYVRTPRDIRVNESWGLAQEIGDWTGHRKSADGLARFSGVYAAKWHRATGGEWLLVSEVFTTLSCSGSKQLCAAPAPASP